MENSFEFITNELKIKKNKLIEVKNTKSNLEEEIEKLEQKLYKICKHQWIIDRSNYGEKTEYICTECLLYKIA